MSITKKIIIVIGALFLFLGVIFLFSFKTKTIDLAQDNNGQANEKIVKENSGEVAEEQPVNISPLSGLECQNYNRRPFAVMISGDAITRPLSGVAQADMVFEMPVITGSITRFMAVFVCEDPPEIGSVRSARHDFIPLAAGVDAIFVHWGGSHFALDRLKDKVVNNLDALTNPYKTFYRKPEAPPPPHDGFTSTGGIINAAQKLGYRMEDKFEGYKFYSQKDIDEQKKEFIDKQFCSKNQQGCSLMIDYPGPFRIKYSYDFDNNLYGRERGSSPEMDRNTKSQVKAKNVIIMIAKSRQIEDQYNDVELEGDGRAIIFQNGRKIEGRWEKDRTNIESKLKFMTDGGQEIKLVPGQTWIEIIEKIEDLRSDFK